MIREWIEWYGYPPTARETGAAVGLGSLSSVAHHLKALQCHGLLRRQAHGSRTVDIRTAAPAPDSGGRGVPVPVPGAIAAGTPFLADQAVEDELTLPVDLVGRPSGEDFTRTPTIVGERLARPFPGQGVSSDVTRAMAADLASGQGRRIARSVCAWSSQ